MYPSDEQIPQLDVLTTLDQNDLHVIGDVSDSNRSAKVITEANLEITIANSANFITELTNNTSFQTNVNNFVTGGGGGGSSGGGSSGKPKSFQVRHLESFASGSNVVFGVQGFQDSEFYQAAQYAPGVSIVYNVLNVEYPSQIRTALDLGATWADADRILGYVFLSKQSVLLVAVSDSTGIASRVYKFDTTNLATPPVLMTAAGQTLGTTAITRMTSDGTDIFFSHDAGNSADEFEIAKYTLSGTTLTYVSTTTLASSPSFNTFAVLSNGDYVIAGPTSDDISRYNSSGVFQQTSSGYNTNYNLTLVNWTDSLYLGSTSTTTPGDYADVGLDFVKISIIGEEVTANVEIKGSKTVIASADVLTLNSVPVTLVAAPEAGHVLEILSVVGSIDFNTTIYATNVNLQIQVGGTAVSSNNALLIDSSDKIRKFTLSSGTLLAATAVTVKTQTGNPTAGNSPITFYVTYRDITL